MPETSWPTKHKIVTNWFFSKSLLTPDIEVICSLICVGHSRRESRRQHYISMHAWVYKYVVIEKMVHLTLHVKEIHLSETQAHRILGNREDGIREGFSGRGKL